VRWKSGIQKEVGKGDESVLSVLDFSFDNNDWKWEHKVQSAFVTRTRRSGFRGCDSTVLVSCDGGLVNCDGGSVNCDGGSVNCDGGLVNCDLDCDGGLVVSC
jgi:hypothetical protein